MPQVTNKTQTTLQKRFYTDILLDSEDICNLSRERTLLQNGVNKNEKMVVYGRRNSGKTSLVKNGIIPWFRNNHPESFVLFADLMQVRNMESLTDRIQTSFQASFKESFPSKTLIQNILHTIQSLRPIISVDALTGEPSFTIDLVQSTSEHSLKEIFDVIQKKILTKMPGLLVFDEFQDIAFVPEAEGILRNILQHFKDIPVIFMGSKKHLLSQIFAKPQAPFADFGFDILFEDIPYAEYQAYIQERFDVSKLTISLVTATLMQDLLFRNAEAINAVGAYLVDQHAHKEITETDVRFAIQSVVKQRQGRYEEFLSTLSDAEENILIALAKYGPVSEPSNKEFLKKVKPSHSTVLKSIRNLMDHSTIEKMQNGYQLCNPLLHYYVLLQR